ncbi:MAG: hypothetical protein NTV86_08530 [Planctomycetota bacterium]|nr:hypothetical protein [Planctomycetota bacterium]
MGEAMDEIKAALAGRWAALAAELKLTGDVAAAGGRIVDCYSQPHRRYHNLEHLQYCLRMLDEVSASLKERAIVEAAIWFHDAVYVPGAQDNEANSAQWAREVLTNLGLDARRVERVASLVMSTDHRGRANGHDARVLCDIDLSILGQPEEVYRRYAAAVRAEAGLEEREFNQRRIEFINWIVNRGPDRPLFHTEAFRSRLEAQAQANLRRERDELQPPP